MESAGMKFYTASGNERDPFVLMKELGMEVIRLRVWVDPINRWSGKEDVLAKAIRAKQHGFKLLINFHYSDFWADPGQQNPPAAWRNHSVVEMKEAIRLHTREILLALKEQGITPQWVQVGNETNDGMLWPLGKASVSMGNYAAFFQSGYDAVKSVDPSIQVMIHISNGFDQELFRWNLDGLKLHGAKWDLVGMSLYPSASNWAELNQQCFSNMQAIVSRYQTPVMICEVGMPSDQPDACHSFLSDLMEKIDRMPQGQGLGVLYWEPQCYGNWKGYTLGAFDPSGRRVLPRIEKTACAAKSSDGISWPISSWISDVCIFGSIHRSACSGGSSKGIRNLLAPSLWILRNSSLPSRVRMAKVSVRGLYRAGISINSPEARRIYQGILRVRPLTF
jgi:arabinogalactan endo-1,4-beta-galactosidase